jgi:hypothetical protein
MSTEVTSGVEVGVDSTEIDLNDTTSLVASNLHSVDTQEQESIVEAHKKEYSIVGDGLYASISTEEAPSWLTGIIDDVVASAVANGLTDYDSLVQDVRNAIDALDTAANSYVEQINFDALVNGLIATQLETLNATYENTYATKVELTSAVATSENSIIQDITDLSVSFNNTIDSRITSVETAFANADSAIASDVDALTASFTSQEANLQGTADAVSGLQTYVGVDSSNDPDGTGMLSRLTTLENQIDGKIEYWFNLSTNDPKSLWTAEEKLTRDGDIWYQTDTNESYYYISSTDSWNAITDKDALQALSDAAQAQEAADGKVSQFFAWSGTTTPDPGFKYWYKTDGVLYYKPSTTWVAVPTVSSGTTYVADGDLLAVYDPIAKDYTYYAFNGVSWQQNGPNGIISNSTFFVDLENDVRDPSGSVATALGELEVSNNAYADAVGLGVESKFSYNSTVSINSSYYQSGFGLNTLATGGDGTEGNPFDSEFWVNAERFVLKSPSYPGVEASFTVTPFGLYLGVEHTEATRNEPKGAYSADTQYVFGDTVTYNGSSYTSLTTQTGVIPVDGDNWQLLAVKGDQGDPGPTGPTGPTGADGATGARGTAVFNYALNLGTTVPTGVSSSSLATYWNATAPSAYDNEINGDTLILTNTSSTAGWTHIYTYNGSSWVSDTALTVNGNMVVDGTIKGTHIASETVTADKIDSRGLSIKDANGNIILAAGSSLSDLTGVGGITGVGAFAALDQVTQGNATTYIANGAIDTVQIRNAAITTAKIEDLSVDTGKIKDLAVDSAKIQDLSVNTLKIADQAVSITYSSIGGTNDKEIAITNNQGVRVDLLVMAVYKTQDTDPQPLTGVRIYKETSSGTTNNLLLDMTELGPDTSPNVNTINFSGSAIAVTGQNNGVTRYYRAVGVGDTTLQLDLIVFQTAR